LKVAGMMRPRNARERKLVLETMRHVVEGLERALTSDVEVVLHDVTKPKSSVVAIANGTITGRRVGSAIISGPFDDLGLSKLLSSEGGAPGEACTIVTDYRTRAGNGNELESTSMLFRDERGRAYAALCVNADRSKLRHVHSILSDLLGEAREPVASAGTEAAPRVETVVQDIVDEAIRASGKPVSIMTKDDKMLAVDQMRQRGIFLIRSSVDMVAKGLGVSRFTIYNYLDELKRSAVPVLRRDSVAAR
jgi:predicted transcriptional regulator YheO